MGRCLPGDVPQVQIQAPESGGEGWGSALLGVSWVDDSILGQIPRLFFGPKIILSSSWEVSSFFWGGTLIAYVVPVAIACDCRMKRRSSWVWKRNCKSWRRRRSVARGRWGRSVVDPWNCSGWFSQARARQFHHKFLLLVMLGWFSNVQYIVVYKSIELVWRSWHRPNS